MTAIGIVHRIDATAHMRTETIEASAEQPAAEVLGSAYGHAAIEAESMLPSPAVSWGEWVRDHPVTVLGAAMLATGDGPSRLTVLAGPDSGFAIDVDTHTAELSRFTGQSHVGPDPNGQSRIRFADPSLSRTPQPLDLRASLPRPFVRLGATILVPAAPRQRAASALRPAAVGRPVSPLGTAPGRLRSRSLVSGPPFGPDTTHIVPAEVDPPQPARPPQWWTFFIPIVIGILLAVTTKMWWFLLFSLSAPLSGYVAFALERRRFARDSRTHAHETRAARTSALAEVEALRTERAAALRRGTGLCLGFGAALDALTIDEALHDVVDHHGGRVVIPDVPVHIDPHTTAVIVTGEPGPLRAMALAWLADERWPWSPSASMRAWPELIGMEFAAAPASGGPTADDSAAGGPATGGHDSATVIGLDLDLDAAVSTLVLRAPDPTSSLSLGLAEIARATTFGSDLDAGPVPGRAFTATLMPPARFVSIAARTASGAKSANLPDHGLGDLVAGDPDSIRHRWEQATRMPVPIGRNGDGTVALDLFHDGPHALVAGTTGSGKSLLLQTWLLSMAEHHPPSALTFVLIDFKGGATFAPLEGLAHTDCVLDDFDSAQAFRALVAVRAEITRRERLLADHGCADVLDLAHPPPRLVVVIDEFHALMATHPRAADLLEHLTALGRSLGIHLILATQRPLGVVTAHMKANISIRICLRVRDAMDSLDVIGTDAAAALPKEVPGAACLDDGTRLTRFRVALPLSAPRPAEVVLRPRVRPWVPGSGLGGSGLGATGTTPGSVGIPPTGTLPTGIDLDALAAVSRNPGRARGPRVVLPALPGPDAVAEVLDSGPACGLVDLPESGRQFPWTYRPDRDGSVLVVGQDAATTSGALLRLAEAAATSHRIVALGRIASVLPWAEIPCDGEEAWQTRSVLDRLGRASNVPTLLVCGNWSEFLDSIDYHDAAAWEALLRHSGQLGLTLSLSGVRGSLSSARIITTRLVLPPPPGEDGSTVGLSRTRFAGTWPDHRAVLVGPGTGADGADIQLVPPPPESVPPPGWAPRSPRWLGLEAVPGVGGVKGVGAPASAESSGRPVLDIGTDPFGATVTWDPVVDGAVLTIRSTRTDAAAEVSRCIRASANESTSIDVEVHVDAHLDGAVQFDPADGRVHIVTLPLRFAVPYGSPLSRATGPLLVLGPHTNQDLITLANPRIPAFDAPPGAGWFIAESRATAVRAPGSAVCAAAKAGEAVAAARASE